MLRKFVSITLLVSIVALASSGLMMILVESIAFQLQMHPVHKIFGIIMSIAGVLHVYYNWRHIRQYLSMRKLAATAAFFTFMLAFLYTVGLNKPIDKDSVSQIEHILIQMESKK